MCVQLDPILSGGYGLGWLVKSPGAVIVADLLRQDFGTGAADSVLRGLMGVVHR